MTNFDPFGFSARLIESAERLLPECYKKPDAGRAVLHDGYLSCELSLKTLLQNVGFSPDELKKCSHNFTDLLILVGACDMPTSGGKTRKATLIRSVCAVPGVYNSTVGNLLDSLPYADEYPSGIRYAQKFDNYDPKTMVGCARAVLDWCRKNFNNLQLPPQGEAHFLLSRVYSEGRKGISKDERKANYWRQRAIKLGYADIARIQLPSATPCIYGVCRRVFRFVFSCRCACAGGC